MKLILLVLILDRIIKILLNYFLEFKIKKFSKKNILIKNERIIHFSCS